MLVYLLFCLGGGLSKGGVKLRGDGLHRIVQAHHLIEGFGE
jgi:hypothetical protein